MVSPLDLHLASVVSPFPSRPRRVESDVDTRNGMGRHIPHVMTLFDRKVDLARFSETTPLYVMCRDWMRNKPQRRQPQINTPAAIAEATDDDVQDQNPLCFPSPQPLVQGERSIIPEPLCPHGTAQNLDTFLEKQVASENGQEGEGEVQDYKEQHLQRWKTIRSRWTATSQAEQDRYKDSLKVLRDMFQR
ncbi:Protein lin-37 homolog [Geodia barretti]|uniref:Protein lin-37 homolog n=1 Tax=Geodia barretti TaxID=519541 RepID=A0AA35R2V0_GEOBA|nr:Protein lin-37 homolog [Geodia barretti]